MFEGPRAPDDVLEFLAMARTPRARATRKLADVLRRLAAGEPPLDRVRSAWVFGSWARGAPTVGDIDLIVQIDEDREPGQQAPDAYYRRAHPYAEIVAAIGCGRSSIVTVDVQPIFEPDPQPVSPWRLARLTAAREPADGLSVPTLSRWDASSRATDSVHSPNWCGFAVTAPRTSPPNWTASRKSPTRVAMSAQQPSPSRTTFSTARRADRVSRGSPNPRGQSRRPPLPSG